MAPLAQYRSMSYPDFLRGRRSTPELAKFWDARFNYGRRFGVNQTPAPAAPAAPVAPAAAPAPAPAAPAPYALPVDPRIEALLMQGRGAVTAGNAGRMALGTNTAFGLTDSGLLERSGAEVRDTQNAGFSEAPDLNNVTYRVIVGPEGRLYRQAYAAIDASAASRGAAYSSARDNAQTDQRRSLDQSLNATLRGFDASQNKSLIDQGKGLDDIAGGIADVRFEQASTQAELPVPEPTPTPVVSTPASPKATTAAPRPASRLPVVKVIKKKTVKPPVVRPASYFRTGWH